MKQIEDGIFQCEGPMPCNPNDIVIRKYVLPSILGRAEPEEAAARILCYSQEMDNWVGVSWDKFLTQLIEEHNAKISLYELRNENWKKENDFQWKSKIYWGINTCTLGAYGLFVKKPKLNLKSVPEVDLPHTLIFMDIQPVVTGVRELAQKGLISVVNIIDGEENTEVFFPTAELIRIVLQKQRADK